MNDDYTEDQQAQSQDDFDPLFDLTQDDPESEPIIEEELKEAQNYLQQPQKYDLQLLKDAGNDQLRILLKVPQESIVNIEITASITQSIQHVKRIIHEQHPLRPTKEQMKLLYAGKLLKDEEILSDILQNKNWKEESQIFHLTINLEKRSIQSDRNGVPNNSNTVAQNNNQRPQINEANHILPQAIQDVLPNAANNNRQATDTANNRQPTKDEYLLSKRYLKFEKNMIKEYQKELLGVKSSKQLKKISQLPAESLNTNLDPMVNAMMTRLPLMERGFQQRLELYSAANNIKTYVIDFNEDIAIRFLGYDSILQFTLLMKLIGFMILFGMNAPGNMKWVCLLMLIAYYFNHVRSLYLEHYEQQRRLLNLQQNDTEQAPRAAMQEFIDNNLLGVDKDILDELVIQQEGTEAQQLALFRRMEDRRALRRHNMDPVFGPIQEGIRIALVIATFFVISLNHDFVEPRLQKFDQQRNFRKQQKDRLKKKLEQRQKVEAEKAAKKEAERVKKMQDENEKQKQQKTGKGLQSSSKVDEEVKQEEVKEVLEPQIEESKQTDGVPYKRVIGQTTEQIDQQLEDNDDEKDYLFDLCDDLEQYN